MELAIRTGWTPDTLGSLPGAFRRACHWRLWVGAIVGQDGLAPIVAPPPGSPAEAYASWAEAKNERKAVDPILFPEDED